MLRILTEASGSMSAAYIIRAIRQAGHAAIASDIDPDCVGRYLATDFIRMPSKNAPDLWEQTVEKLIDHKVNAVIPSLDETLSGWAERQQQMSQLGIDIILSPVETVRTFQDKWQTYQFFVREGIPTPATSLEQIFPLVKPRNGRGAVGVRVEKSSVEMDGMISQELASGIEYTVDVFCDKESHPVYIVPRRREGVIQGKSTGGIVEKQPLIEEWVQKICRAIPFAGPVNMQCFLQENGEIQFIEINPRIAGGMALGFAATENWISLMVDHFIYGKRITPKPIQYGLKMKRYYAEVFVSNN
ncbi:ATP-grasp domain-containing protein [Brevibacillus sp. FSL K6-0770]|uniref:ATP-grasp domain-containing protein n=1 Tax=Brevibacillus TaxID=55080 RepID=UPI000EC5ADB4|nr:MULTISPECIES: ATP-grasp domain-containing protein [Brevibacillus]MDH6350873.1 carbamoyl-phosphate synthase large subunit [Brevibacillus sp. 1238]MDR4997929.1 ATP-grasp domain-containing protein [Brevibacillus parabrevis]NRQ53471.1 ATP-grasp domain-containing protein [Brevibacillus sp. HD1.4A]HBZ81753.1 carbamoylphosphate synthase large subunit [Brevibacillus sp.]